MDKIRYSYKEYVETSMKTKQKACQVFEHKLKFPNEFTFKSKLSPGSPGHVPASANMFCQIHQWFQHVKWCEI